MNEIQADFSLIGKHCSLFQCIFMVEMVEYPKGEYMKPMLLWYDTVYHGYGAIAHHQHHHYRRLTWHHKQIALFSQKPIIST